jgi:DNA-binding transcriptional LysR family regulator
LPRWNAIWALACCLERRARSAPTEAGLAFYERARRALDEADEAWLIARRSGSGIEGRRLIVASPRYLEQHGEPHEPADLHRHTAIVYSQNVGGERWKFRRGSAEVSVSMRSRLAFSAAEGVREGVIAGPGVAIASEWMISPEPADGSAVRILREWTLPTIDLWAVYPSGRLPSAKARAFVSYCSDRIRRPPSPVRGKKAAR